jgi:glucose-1-phosphate thymidylyltransferase
MTNKLSVILLAAGYGTRLYPLTEDCPKTLLPVGSGVILDYILKELDETPGILKTVLVSNEKFFAKFNEWEESRNRNVELINDGSVSPETRLGAIKDLMLGISRIDSESDILVLGTDNLFTWPLKEMISFAKSKQPFSTIAVRNVSSAQEASRCGVVEMDKNCKVIRCIEKPKEPPSLTVALCIYYFRASIKERIKEFIKSGGNADAPGFFIEWLARQETVYGFMTGGEWFDVGTQESYDLVCERWKGK